MPWTAADAERHKKGLSPEAAAVWARVANDVLERTGDEGQSVRAANAAAGRVGKGKKKAAVAERAIEIEAELAARMADGVF